MSKISIRHRDETKPFSALEAGEVFRFAAVTTSTFLKVSMGDEHLLAVQLGSGIVIKLDPNKECIPLETTLIIE